MSRIRSIKNQLMACKMGHYLHFIPSGSLWHKRSEQSFDNPRLLRVENCAPVTKQRWMKTFFTTARRDRDTMFLSHGSHLLHESGQSCPSRDDILIYHSSVSAWVSLSLSLYLISMCHFRSNVRLV